ALTYLPSQPIDLIITNPPFTGKIKLFERFFRLCIPFAMLVTTRVLGTMSIKHLFRGYFHDLYFVFPGKRIDYISSALSKKSKCPFMSFWVLYKLNGGRNENNNNNCIIRNPASNGLIGKPAHVPVRKDDKRFVMHPQMWDILVPYLQQADGITKLYLQNYGHQLPDFPDEDPEDDDDPEFMFVEDPRSADMVMMFPPFNVSRIRLT